ncbi:hypothetical protein NBRC116583_21710 [Arenicella sp. 4NH20-0111]|uniref:outer membrane beta-barrel protein n=1 Tax=Arenicella sp. 4NH20-0111 TaxID=3127648 RepID=UPI003106B1EF
MFLSGLSRFATTLATATILLSSSSIQASEDGPFFGKRATGKWTIGAKAVNIDPQEPAANDASGTGIVLGYEFDKKVAGGTTSFELELISGDEEQISLINGVNELPTFPFPTTNGPILGTYEAQIVNAFFTYRSAGDLYFKLKGGLSYVDLDIDFGQFVIDRSSEDTSLAGGIGIGYRFGDRGMIELDYYKDSGNVDLGVASLNALLTF